MKVLIIDDEPNVRAGIKMLIPWKDCGFEVIGEAEDGQEGLMKILSLQPELVLIDIRMPGLSGLEVVGQARSSGYQGKFIITTGYSDFPCAQKAISLGVSTYLLKPIDEDELLVSVKEVHAQIIEEQEQRKKLDMSKAYIQNSLISNLVMGKKLSEVEKRYYRELEDKCTGYYVIICDLAENNGNLDGLIEMIRNYLKGRGLIYYDILIHEQMVLIVHETAGLIQILQELQEKVKTCCKNTLQIAKSEHVESLQDISCGYGQAKMLLSQYFLFPEAKIITNSFVNSFHEKKIDMSYRDVCWVVKKLHNLVQVGDEGRICVELNNLKFYFQHEGINEQRIISVCTNILLKVVQQSADTYNELVQSLPNEEDIIEHFYECKHIDAVMAYMEAELTRLIQVFNSYAPENTMQKIVYYIDNNYGNELKLEYLAELFNYNSSYLGKSFKNYTGKSFNTYLEQLRINKAKELLIQGDMKVYEIGKVVGYKHMDYFYSKFKKYVGVSPLEYKKTMEME